MQQKSILKNVGLAVRLFTLAILFLGFSSDVFASVPSVGGINLMQQHINDDEKQVNWCRDYDSPPTYGDGSQMQPVAFNDSLGYPLLVYPEQSAASSDFDWITDHSDDCFDHNTYYRTPRGIPDASQGSWVIQFIIGGNPGSLSGLSEGDFLWYDAEGDQTDCATGGYTEVEENYSFGGRTYTILSFTCPLTQGDPADYGSGGWFEGIRDFPVALTDFDEDLFWGAGASNSTSFFYMTYTTAGSAADITQISNSTEMEQFMDAVNGHPWLYNGVDDTTGNWVTPGQDSTFGSQYSTRFTDFDLTGTTIGTFSSSWYINPAEVNRTIPLRNPTEIRFRWFKRGETGSLGQSEFIGEVTGFGTTTTEFNAALLEDGTYDAVAQFSNIGCFLSDDDDDCPFKDAKVYLIFTVLDGEITDVSSPQFEDAFDENNTDTENSSNFLQTLGNFYGGIIDNKHPFAWVSDSYDLLKTKLLVQHEYTELEFTFDLAPQVTTATTSSGYLNWKALDDLGVNTTINTSPIAEACSHMVFSTPALDTCGTLRTIIGYIFYILTMLFIARLVHKILVTDQH